MINYFTNPDDLVRTSKRVLLEAKITNFKKIITALEKAFVKFDKDYLESEVTFFLDKFKILQDYWKKNSEDKKNGVAQKSSEEKYKEIFRLVGGKSVFDIIHGRNASMVEDIATKMANNTIEKRNAKIVLQLEEMGILEVSEGDVKYSRDGFNGIFTVMTESGKKTIRIDTILAGGHNIQRLHYRTLVKIGK